MSHRYSLSACCMQGAVFGDGNHQAQSQLPALPELRFQRETG